MPLQRRHTAAQPGQSILLFAFVLTGMLALLALTVDAGTVYLTRQRLQTAADAAARAAARYLALGYHDGEIVALIASLSAANGCTSPCTSAGTYVTVNGDELQPTGTGSIPAGTAGVQILAARRIPGYFSGIIGREGFEVQAMATAIFGSLGSATCQTMLPLVVNGDANGDGAFDGNFSLGACYLLRDEASAPSSRSFGWADLNGGGGGASELRSWIEGYADSGDTGCRATITVGAPSANIALEPGAKAALQDSLEGLILSAHNEGIVPIYDVYGNDSACSNGSASGGLCYHVRGFGRFRISDVWLTGSDASFARPNPDSTPCSRALFGMTKGVLGQFIAWVDPNGQISATAQGPAQVVNLIR